jgi:hypothetical protein
VDVDVPLLTSFITRESLCAECIAHKTGLAVTRVDEIVIGLHTNAKVARCDACLKQTVVHRLGTMGARSREQTNWRAHGSFNDRLVMSALAYTGALCRRCISTVTGISPPAVETIIARVGKSLTIGSAVAPCDACHTRTIVFRVETPWSHQRPPLAAESA